MKIINLKLVILGLMVMILTPGIGNSMLENNDDKCSVCMWETQLKIKNEKLKIKN